MAEQAQGQGQEQAQGQEQGQAQGQAGTKPFLETVPAEFRDKPWAKENAKDADTFFKFVDNQNTLVGKKGIIIPGDDAKPEQVAEFRKALGVPEKEDEYDLPPIEELKDKKRDDGFVKSVKMLFHQAGVPKTAAAKVSQGFEKLMLERSKALLDSEKAADVAFEKLNTEFFGDKKEAIVANAQKILREALPDAVKPALDKLNADQLAMIIAVTDSIYKKFGKEDGFRGGDGAGAVGNETFDELSATQRELMKDPAFSNWQDPKHAALMEKNNIILDKMRKLRK